MNNLFQKTSADWAKYSEYEYRQGEDGNIYLAPTLTAKPSVYDPMKDTEAMVVDALNVGRLAMKDGGEYIPKQEILDFATKYGLLGFMTALPTTPNFMDYEAVYLPKNHFIKEETMSTEGYLSLFFPFDKPDVYKDKGKVQWDVSAAPNEDRSVLALVLTFQDEPMAMSMSFLREYAERVDWLARQFRDWAFTFVSSYLYYEDYDHIDETTRNIYRQGMVAFGGIAPTYHIALYDRPTIVWDFRSLLLGIQMMFSFAMVDEKNPLRCCKHCGKVFIAGHTNAAFCSSECKNRFNVYKSRKDKEE